MSSALISMLGKQFSIGTQQLAQKTAAAAQAAGASIAAGLRTCDERSARFSDALEFRIHENFSAAENSQFFNNRRKCRGAFKEYGDDCSDESEAAAAAAAMRGVGMGRKSDLVQHGVTVPSTAMALMPLPKSNPNGEVWGSHFFDFSLSLADSGPNIGCLVASASRAVTAGNAGTGAGVRIRCRWKRKIGQQQFDIPGVFGTVYPISADDVFCKIVVEATSMDSAYKNQVAYGELGPFDLDSVTRKHLFNYLALGSTRFIAYMQPNSDDLRASQSDRQPYVLMDRDDEDGLTVSISASEVKVIKQGNGYINEWNCSYGSEYPVVLLNSSNPTVFELVMGPDDRRDIVRLRAPTRNQRDLLTLTIRCFYGRQHALNSALLQAVGFIEGQRSSLGSSSSSGSSGSSSSETDSSTDDLQIPPLDFLLLIQSLNSQLFDSLDKQEKCMKERDRAVIEKDALEQDIASTLEAYRQLMTTQNLQRDEPTTETVALGIQQRSSRAAELEMKLKEAQLQSEKHIRDLELLRRDYRSLENQLAASLSSSPSSPPSSSSSSSSSSVLADPALSAKTREPFQSVVTGGTVPAAPATNFNYSTSAVSIRSEKRTFASSSLNSHESLQNIDTFATVELRKHLADLQQQQANIRLEESGRTRDDGLGGRPQERRKRQQQDRQQAAALLLSSSLLPSSSFPASSSFAPAVTLNRNTEYEKELQDKNAALDRELAVVKSEFDELTKNFLYIKSKYDELRLSKVKTEEDLLQASIQSQEALEGLSHSAKLMEKENQHLSEEVQKLKAKIETLTAEKNRLNRKIESLNIELEKHQNQYQTQTQILMAVNAKLSSDKTVVEGEMRRLETTLLLTKEQELTKSTTVEELRNKLDERENEIEALKNENQNLKSRIRKLAAAS